jgi:hypothetical protein
MLPKAWDDGDSRKMISLKSSSIIKAFQRPKKGRFNEIDIDVVKYLANMWQEAIHITRESIQIK